MVIGMKVQEYRKQSADNPGQNLCGGGLLFLFRGDGSRGQKLENRWNCLNSFARGCKLRPTCPMSTCAKKLKCNWHKINN